MHPYRSTRFPALLTLVILLSLMLSGCGGTQVAAVGATLPATATSAPTNTPEPTSTSTPAPTNTATATPTKVPTATPNRKATSAAKATATQAAIDEMVAKELEKYNIDPSLGHVAWVMDEPYVLAGEEYGTSWFRKIEELGVLKDFVIQSEITWNTTTGFAGCGYVFRGPDDWDVQTSDFYDLVIMRIQYAPIWFMEYYKDGQVQYWLPSSKGVSSADIEDENDTKNILTLDARGSTFTVYINGVKQQVVENNKVTEGRIAFEVWQESGKSFCLFENAWIWEYDN